MEIEATQAIPLSDYDDDDETDEETEQDKSPVGFLKVLLRKGYPEKQFPVYEGYNLIGRDAACNIQIDLKALSKQHACIEVKSGQHFVVDQKSKNKTRRNKIYLLPEARYEICNGDRLTFADVECIYTKSDDSSMENKTEGAEKTVVDDTFEEERSEPSSDLLQPTQKFPGHLDPIKKNTGLAGSSMFMYASDSEESETETTGKPFSGQETLVAETPVATIVKAGGSETCVPDSQAADTTCLNEGPTETVIFDDDATDDESDSELRRRIAMEPTQAYGNMVEDSDTTDGEDSAGFAVTGTASSKKGSLVPREDVGTTKSNIPAQGRGGVSGTVKYSMDIASTQAAQEIKSENTATKTGKTLAYDMDFGTVQTYLKDKEDSVTTDSQTMPTQTFSCVSKSTIEEKESSENTTETRINLGFGATMAYEHEECSSDEEDYIIPPLRKQFRDIPEEVEVAETQVFSGDEDTATVAVTGANDTDDEEGCTKRKFRGDASNKETRKSRQGRTTEAAAEEATQCIETVAVDSLTQKAKPSETATQDVGNNDDDEGPTQVIPEILSNSDEKKRRRENIRDAEASTQAVGADTETQVFETLKVEKVSPCKRVLSPADIRDSEAPTQAFGADTETQVFETLEVPAEKGSPGKSPMKDSVPETVEIEHEEMVAVKDKGVKGQRGRGRGRGRGASRDRGRKPIVTEEETGSKILDNEAAAEFETQVVDGTSPARCTADVVAETQVLGDTETQVIVVESKTMIKTGTGKFSPHKEVMLETMDETQVFDQGKPEGEIVLNVGMVTSVASKVATRESFYSNMAATQKFDDPSTPNLLVQKATNVVQEPQKNTDELATQLFEDAPTQVFSNADNMSTQSFSEDQTVEMDSDGFVKPKLPVVKINKVPPTVTDDLYTQVYDADTDEETETGKDDDSADQEKNNNNDGNSSTAEKTKAESDQTSEPMASDKMETQAYETPTQSSDPSPVLQKTTPRNKSRRSKPIALSENTDMLATQVFDDSPDKHQDMVTMVTDTMATQAYVMEEEDELPDLEMELSVADANASKAEETTSKKTKTAEKFTEEVVQSSQAENDRQPVSVVPDLTITSPAARGSKRKLGDKAESSMKKQKIESNKESETKGKRGRKRKNPPKDEQNHREDDDVSTDVLDTKGTDEPEKVQQIEDADVEETEQEETMVTKRGRGRPSLKGGDKVSQGKREEGTAEEEVTMETKGASQGRRGRRKTFVSTELIVEQTSAVEEKQEKSEGLKRVRKKQDSYSEAVVKGNIRGRRSLRAESETAVSDVSDTESLGRRSRRSKEPSPALSGTSEEPLSQKSKRLSKRGKASSPALSSASEDLIEHQKSRGRTRRSKEPSPALSGPSEAPLSQKSKRGKTSSTALSSTSEDLEHQKSRRRRSKEPSPALSNTSEELSQNSKRRSGKTASTTSKEERATSSTKTKAGRGRGMSKDKNTVAMENLKVKSEMDDSDDIDSVDDTGGRVVSKGRGRGKWAESIGSRSSSVGRESRSSSVGRGSRSSSVGRGRGNRGKAASPGPREEVAGAENTGNIPKETESESKKGKPGRGKKNKIDETEEPETVDERESNKGKSRRGRKKKANETEEPETVEETETIKGKSGTGRKKQALVIDEPVLVVKTETESNKGKSGRERKNQQAEDPVAKKSRQSIAELKRRQVDEQEGSTSLDHAVSPGKMTRSGVSNIKEEPKEIEEGKEGDAVITDKVVTKSKKGGKKAGATNKNLKATEDASSGATKKEAMDENKMTTQDDSETSTTGQAKKRGRPSKGNLLNNKPIKKEKGFSEPPAETATRGSSKATSDGKSASSTPKNSKTKSETLGSSAQSLTPINHTARRRTLERKPRIMFTGVVDEEGQKIVKSLGGDLVDSINECTHLVTDKVRRTVKFLCGVARGLYIVNITWLERCQDARMFIDAKPFLVSDKAAEKTHKFSLSTSLETSLSEGGMLTGYRIHVTKNVKPGPDMMKEIITSAGGEFLSAMPKKVTGDVSRTIVISCEEDFNLYKTAQNQGIAVVGAELILTGILRQEVKTDEHLLSNSQSSGKAARGTSKKR